VLDLRRLSLRLTTGLALVMVAIVELQALGSTLADQARARDRVTRRIRASIHAARPKLHALLRPGGLPAWAAAVREVRGGGLASEVAVLDLDGRVLHAEPPLEAAASLSAQDVELLREEGSVTVGPVMGAGSRLVSYLGFDADDGKRVLRLATPVPELVEDLRERRPLFVAHAVALALLAAAAVMVLIPSATSSAHSPDATLAYEAAMARLRDRALNDQRQLQRVEEELREKAALARSGEFAAGVAHEMRNGLATILGYARLIERGEAEPAKSARAIRDECETLEIAIRRFMEFVREETLAVASFDVGRMLARVVARESRSRPVGAVETDFGEGSTTFEGDEGLLERAFENLVRNALEAAGVGGRVAVELARGADEALVVTVTDDGPGLPEAVRANPRPFVSTKPHGLGLGLALAMKIIRLHGGDLALSDAERGGLRVTVRLP
jgi:signal transduction histidine kinase